MGGFTIYKINYPMISHDEELFRANLSMSKVILGGMLQASTDGFKGGLVSGCPDCLTSVLRRQPFLKAAEDALQWLSQLSPTVESFMVVAPMMVGDDNKRTPSVAWLDPRVAKEWFSLLVRALRQCEDEFIHLRDDEVVCEHEDWDAPELNVGSEKAISELGLENPSTNDRQQPQTAAPSETTVAERARTSDADGFTIYRISDARRLVRANLAVRDAMLNHVRKAHTDDNMAGTVSRCPDCITSILKRRAFLTAAEEALDYVENRPMRIREFADSMAIMAGNHHNIRPWAGGRRDRDITVSGLRRLVRFLGYIEDEFIYLQDEYVACTHEDWHPPEREVGSQSASLQGLIDKSRTETSRRR